MKLRVRGNSIRLRLSRGDLTTLRSSGAVEARVAFPGGASLCYRLERVRTPTATASFAEDAIVIGFPADAVERWMRPEEVSMRAEQRLADGEVLALLVEKDFRCLNPSGDEDDADLFPNPDA